MKQTKMSLANLEGKMSREEMKKIMAGSRCVKLCGCLSASGPISTYYVDCAASSSQMSQQANLYCYPRSVGYACG